MNTWLSIIPPLLAILLALRTKQVILSLILGIFSGVFILAQGNLYLSLIGTIELLVEVMGDPGNIRVLLFSLLIGAVVFLVQRSGGVGGFLELLSGRKLVNTPRKAGLVTTGIGLLLFLEGSISILMVGTVAKPLFKKFGISKQKLAYLADSTCAPLKVLIPFNGWGAYLLAQLANGNVQEPVKVLVSSIPFFIYPIVAFILTLLVILVPFDFGPMRNAEIAAQLEKNAEDILPDERHGNPRHARYFFIPIAVLVGGLFFFMFMTGEGQLIRGDGSKSILYAILTSLIVSFVYFRLENVFSVADFMKICLEGMNHLLEVVIILALAFSINAVCQKLQTGFYVADLLQERLPLFLIPALIFFVSSIISFATGTSWGTFAIMLGIGIPLAGDLGLSLPLIVGAIVSGGVWGDHCSPVSDTTILSALASDCSLMDHVRTQLPYALLGGGVTILFFLAAGFMQ